METIPLKSNKYKGLLALIDDEDIWVVRQHSWCPHFVRNLTTNDKFYAVSRHGNDRIYLHRLVMNAQPGQIIDHINGNRLDCRKSNLRFCTHQQNMSNRNKKLNATSRYLGVVRHGLGWRAQLTSNGKTFRSKTVYSEEHAAMCYDALAEKHHGEFARLNNIKSSSVLNAGLSRSGLSRNTRVG